MIPRTPALAALLALTCLSGSVRADALLDEVLAADRAFSARSAEAGAQSAFLEVLAPDAVLFRPTAVNGIEWLQNHEEASGRLEWSPGTGRVACDGQLAVTLGPWTYRQDALVDTGYYLTVWRRNEAGAWVVAVDHGIDGPPGAVAAGQGLPPLDSAPRVSGAPTCAADGDAKGLAGADEKFNAGIRRKGLAASLRRVLAPEGIVLRDDHVPARPTADWPRDESDGRAPLEAKTRGAFTVPGSDLGYTYGELTARNGRKASAAGRAVFLRVWLRDERTWQLLADMTTPLPAD